LSFHPFLDDPDDFSLPFLAEILKSELIALEKLVLHFHDFPDDRIGALAEALNDNSTLKVIEISLDLGTSDSALKVLIDAVGTIKTLEALKFKDMSWSASRAEMVADGIANNKTLMLLEMGYPFAALSDERAEIFTNTLASIPNLEILTLHCTHGVSNFSTRMHEGEDCKISILAKAFEGNQKLSVLRLEAENIDLMRHGVLALFKNKNIAKLTLTFFPKKEYESELLNALKDNLTLISFKLISESSIDSFANKGIEDKCTKYIKRNKDKFYDFYSAIRRFESATTEVIPNDVAKLIFGKTFPYFNQYIEPSW
ncbi:MAG: protein NLRC3-like, partial [Solimicrobium sp.]|nr:protein NLRC3-like [Solimicrobium sp.]